MREREREREESGGHEGACNLTLAVLHQRRQLDYIPQCRPLIVFLDGVMFPTMSPRPKCDNDVDERAESEQIIWHTPNDSCRYASMHNYNSSIS